MNFFDVYALIALFTFFSLLISKSILTHLKGEKVIALGKHKNGKHRFLELFFYVGTLFLTYLVILSAFDLRFLGVLDLVVLFDTITTSMFGFICLNLSIIVFAFALASFKEAWRIGVDHQDTKTLITTGIFSYTRNPVYIAIILLFLGYFLLYSNFFFLGALFFIIIAFNHQIKQEETLLEATFQDEYRHYKTHTPRYFFIKK